MCLVVAGLVVGSACLVVSALVVGAAWVVGAAVVVGAAAVVGSLSTFRGATREEEGAAVEEGAAEEERTLQRLVSPRRRMDAPTMGSGCATGMAARWATSRWWTPRAMWGLARAERATERTTRVLEKNMSRKGQVGLREGGEGLGGLLKGGRERAYISLEREGRGECRKTRRGREALAEEGRKGGDRLHNGRTDERDPAAANKKGALPRLTIFSAAAHPPPGPDGAPRPDQGPAQTPQPIPGLP